MACCLCNIHTPIWQPSVILMSRVCFTCSGMTWNYLVTDEFCCSYRVLLVIWMHQCLSHHGILSGGEGQCWRQWDLLKSWRQLVYQNGIQRFVITNHAVSKDLQIFSVRKKSRRVNIQNYWRLWKYSWLKYQTVWYVYCWNNRILCWIHLQDFRNAYPWWFILLVVVLTKTISLT